MRHWTLTASRRTLKAFVCVMLEQSILSYTRLSHSEVRQATTRVVCGRLAGGSSTDLKHRRCTGGAEAQQRDSTTRLNSLLAF